MSNNKQSSVDWLLDRIEDVDSAKIWEEIKKQAKAMHKEECKESYYESLLSNFQTFEQYYNETFGE